MDSRVIPVNLVIYCITFLPSRATAIFWQFVKRDIGQVLEDDACPLITASRTSESTG